MDSVLLLTSGSSSCAKSYILCLLFGPDPVFRLFHPLALPPTTHYYHDQCIYLDPVSRGSSHRHGQSPSGCEVLGTSCHAIYGFRVARSTLRPASEHWLPACFQRCQLRMQLQRLHVPRGRFRETPLMLSIMINTSRVGLRPNRTSPRNCQG